MCSTTKSNKDRGRGTYLLNELTQADIGSVHLPCYNTLELERYVLSVLVYCAFPRDGDLKLVEGEDGQAF